MAGDVRRLQNSHDLPDNWKKGLADRITGGLAGLAILLRQADQENGNASVQSANATRQIVKNMLMEFSANNHADIIIVLETLVNRYTLRKLPVIKDRKTAHGLHNEYCAACHDDPDLTVERPAFNLFKQAKQLSRKEFTARLIVGVRGDRSTGLGNPLTSHELSALVEYYREQVFSNQ